MTKINATLVSSKSHLGETTYDAACLKKIVGSDPEHFYIEGENLCFKGDISEEEIEKVLAGKKVNVWRSKT